MNRGARFFKCDLHLHTPGDSYFNPHKSDVDVSLVKEYVKKLREKEIEIGAITDHNKFYLEWFNALSEEAQKEDIYLFPGVEISVGDGKEVHLLVIFPQEGKDRIEDILTALFDAKERFDNAGRPLPIRRTLEDVVNKLVDEEKAIVIGAHASNPKGLCKFSWRTIKGYMEKGLLGRKILALQDVSESDWNQILQRRQEIESENPNFKIILPARIHASDPKRLNDIGSKFSYIKMIDPPNFESLVLAFKTHELRIKDELPSYTYTQILKFECEKGEFLEGFNVSFSPELNLVIGPRGSGKTAFMEALRYTLGLEPPSEEGRRIHERIVEKVIGSGGKCKLTLKTKEGVQYEIERIFNETPRVYRISNGQREELNLMPSDILSRVPIFIYGQKEIYYISQDINLKEKFIDRFAGEELKNQIEKSENIKRQIKIKWREYLDLKEKVSKKEEIQKQLESIEDELRTFKEQKIADKLEKDRKYVREERRLVEIKESLDILKETLSSFEEESKIQFEKLTSVYGEINKDLFKQFTDFARDKKRVWERQIQEFGKIISELGEEYKKVEKCWQERRKIVTEELADIRKTIKGPLKPERYIELERRKAILSPQLAEIKRYDEKKKDIEEEIRRLLSSLKDSWYQEWLIRDRKAKELTKKIGKLVEWKVVFKGNKKEFARRLKEIFGGLRIREEDFIKLADFFSDGIELYESLMKNDSPLPKVKVTQSVWDKMRRFIENDSENALSLLLIRVPDIVDFSLLIENRYIPSDDLSVGQRCTAIILTLLVESDSPLLIDQPEDDLDNTIIYEGLIKKLWEYKSKRQFIFTSHNANIPVNGDAELIISLGSPKENKVMIHAVNPLDDPLIRKDILEVMEGGEDAFRKREEKYFG